MVCPFCGSEFLVEMEKSEAFDVENVINPAFFKSEWDIGHIREKSNGKIFLREFMYCVNEIGTREGILDYVFSLLDKDHSSDLATEKHNFELYSKVNRRKCGHK